MEGTTLDIRVQGPAAPAVVIDAKTYTLTPESVSVQAGIMAGEITGMRVVERIEKSSGRVVSPARLTGTLKLINASTNQSVRLVAGKIQYLDDQWRSIEIEESRTDASFTFSAYGSERLDPGQQAAQGTPPDDHLHSVPLQGRSDQLRRVDRRLGRLTIAPTALSFFGPASRRRRARRRSR